MSPRTARVAYYAVLALIAAGVLAALWAIRFEPQLGLWPLDAHEPVRALVFVAVYLCWFAGICSVLVALAATLVYLRKSGWPKPGEAE